VRWQLKFTQCNLKCPYCIATWTKRPVEFEAERFDAIIGRLLDLPFRLVIRLGVEGEIFLSPAIQDGVARLSHQPQVAGVSFSTNLVASDEKIAGLLDRADPQKLGVGATLHDTQITDIDGFFRKVEMVQKRGVLIYVGYVAKPDRFEQLKSYKQRLDAMGVPFLPNEYNGALEGRPYPQAYTAKEREFLKENFFAPHYYRMLVERDDPRGKPCLAGHRYIYLGHDGTIRNCGMDRNLEWNVWMKMARRVNEKWPEKIQAWRLERNKLGNILDGGLPLSDSLRACPHSMCTCGNEVQALCEVGQGYHRTRTLRVIYPKENAAEYEARYPNLWPIDEDGA
jgi:MoaA/NifB/PqqE/SkfB family radical SAM enzyme